MKYVKKLFNEFLNSEVLADYCNHILERLKDDIVDREPNKIYESRTFVINIIYVDSSKQKLLPTSENEKYISVLHGNSYYSYELFKLNGVNNPQVLDKSKKLELVKEGVLVKNEILHIEPFVHILQSKSNYKGFLLVAESKVVQDYVWYFDMETLFPVSYNFTNKNHKRLEGTLELLNEIGNKNSIEPLYKLTFHENHTIRWKSLQKLINLDYEKGIEALKRMTEDPHLDIRVAAQKTLERILKE